MAGPRSLTWRKRCEDAAASDDLSPEMVREMLQRAVLGVLSELPDGPSAAHAASALFDSWGSLQVKIREASPADEGGFAQDVAAQLVVLNGGPMEIAWPKPKDAE